MARKPKELKPMFGLKHDFYESLDNLLQQTINLIQSVDQVLKADLISNKGVAEILKERNAAVRKALMSDEN